MTSQVVDALKEAKKEKEARKMDLLYIYVYKRCAAAVSKRTVKLRKHSLRVGMLSRCG